mgnify:CR=1 FL=1|tara:strand:+ start:648 stop:1472 length:825 start_codon:yes stop_codon:yes gene_type:complete
MELIIGSHSYILNDHQTDFMDFWKSRVFNKSNNVRMDIHNTDYLEYQLNATVQHIRSLNSHIDKVNNRITELGIEDIVKLFNNVSEHSTIDIRNIHYQWATVRKAVIQDSIEHVLDAIDEVVIFDQLNELCHNIEFGYKFLNTNFKFHNTIDFTKYTIKPEDTSFNATTVKLPYSDIGRPGFENWQTWGQVNSEASNYKLITPHIEIFFKDTYESVNQSTDYIKYCSDNNMPIYGNYVNIASIVDDQKILITSGKYFDDMLDAFSNKKECVICQ